MPFSDLKKIFFRYFRQKGAFFPRYLHILNDAKKDAKLLILPLFGLCSEVVLDSSRTFKAPLELFGSVLYCFSLCPVLRCLQCADQSPHKLENAKQLLVAAEMSTLCSSG